MHSHIVSSTNSGGSWDWSTLRSDFLMFINRTPSTPANHTSAILDIEVSMQNSLPHDQTFSTARAFFIPDIFSPPHFRNFPHLAVTSRFSEYATHCQYPALFGPYNLWWNKLTTSSIMRWSFVPFRSQSLSDVISKQSPITNIWSQTTNINMISLPPVHPRKTADMQASKTHTQLGKFLLQFHTYHSLTVDDLQTGGTHTRAPSLNSISTICPKIHLPYLSSRVSYPRRKYSQSIWRTWCNHQSAYDHGLYSKQHSSCEGWNDRIPHRGWVR